MSSKTFAYTGSQAGVHVFSYDSEHGTFALLHQTSERFHAGALLPGRRGSVLYCADSCSDLPGSRAGGGSRIFAYAVNSADGSLRLTGVTPTLSATAVDLAFDRGEGRLFVAHYGGNEAVTKVEQNAFGQYQLMVKYDDATVSVFALDDTGAVGKLLDVRRHFGCGPRKDQRHAHPHSIRMSPDGNFFAVCDSGADALYLYTLGKDGRLSSCGEPVRLTPGAAPRAGLFHPAKPYYYLCDESRGCVPVYALGPGGKLTPVGSCPVGQDGAETQAMPDLCVSPDGERLYVLCENSIAVCSISPSGLPERIQTVDLGTHFPSKCVPAPDGRFFHVLCGSSGTIVTFAVGQNGTLTPEPAETQAPGCTCLTFIQAQERG